MAGLAEKMFWRSPQLVDNLINFLDVESVAELAKANQFTAELLESSKKTWGELVQRSLCGGACAEDLCRGAAPSISTKDFRWRKVITVGMITPIVRGSKTGLQNNRSMFLI